MTKLSNLLRLGSVFGLAVLLGEAFLPSGSAHAQSVYCPATTGVARTGAGVTLNGGQCSNALGGAFSGAALASQTVGDIAGSASSLETNTATSAISERKNAPAACQPSEINVDGVCKPRPAPVATPAPVVVRATPHKTAAPDVVRRKPVTTSDGGVVQRRPIRRREVTEVEAPTPVVLPTHKYGAPEIYDDSFRIGSWAQGFGSYERRTGNVNNPVFNCCAPGNNPNTPLAINVTADTAMGGIIGGVDFTKRGLTGLQDGFIFGLLGGYDWTRINVRTSIISSNQAGVANGSSLTNVSINGPSLGFYATYFNGPFSNEFMLKNDFFSLNQSNTQTLGFGFCNCINPVPPPLGVPFAGASSTRLNQLTLTDNVTYKIPLNAQLWWAPTVGGKLVESFYGGGAAAMGLANGHVFTIQGGAKIGMETFLGDTRLTSTLTGLLFSDVSVAGNNVQTGGFGPFGNVLNDQGIVQGQAIASLNFDLGHGLSTNVEGDVYGGRGRGQSIFGAGGRVGVRMQW